MTACMPWMHAAPTIHYPMHYDISRDLRPAKKARPVKTHSLHNKSCEAVKITLLVACMYKAAHLLYI